MIDKTLARIEAALKTLRTPNARAKADLLAQISKLKAEVAKLSAAHAEHAQSIAGFTEVATHEATRTRRSQQLLDVSLAGLAASAKEFETSHPRLREAVNEICRLLAGIGI